MNGFIVANSEGYSEAKYQISSNEEFSADIQLDKLYEIPINANIKTGSMLVSFESEGYSTSVLYPDTKTVKLKEGYYNVSAYVYQSSSLKFPALSERKCVNVPKTGIKGLLGMEEEKSIDVEIPEQQIDMAIIGGGKTQDYFVESQLESSQEIKITAPLFKTPSTIQELQNNYDELEDSIIEVSL